MAEAFCIRAYEKEQDAYAGAEEETRRLEQAIFQLKESLNESAGKAGEETAAILEAESILLEDPGFAGAAFEKIAAGSLSAEEAVRNVGIAQAEKLRKNSNPYIRSRAEDVVGLTEDLLFLLRGTGREKLTRRSVVVAKELSPAYFSGLDSSLIAGIVTEKGSPVSHVSIMAGNYGIPYIYGAKDVQNLISPGENVIIEEGRLILDADEETYRRMEEQIRQQEQEAAECREYADDTQIPEELPVKIYANAGSVGDVERIRRKGIEGIGLLRTEFLFLDNDREPSEDEQYAAYVKAAALMGERELVIRTMDLGADKMADWLPMPEENNPALGCRGIRLSLNHVPVFKKQLRALLRAAVHGNIRILLPMISSVWELERVRELVEECGAELEEQGLEFRVPLIGVMMETPAAVMLAEELAAKADFFSIGTNDLTQYTLAIDREAEGMDAYYDACHESIFRMIGMICEAAHRQGIPVSVCGELAGNEKALPRLISAGVDELSVSVAKSCSIRKKVAALLS